MGMQNPILKWRICSIAKLILFLYQQTPLTERFLFSLPLWQTLVGGWPTPLKNMSSSVGMILPNIWKKHSSKPPTSIQPCVAPQYILARGQSDYNKLPTEGHFKSAFTADLTAGSTQKCVTHGLDTTCWCHRLYLQNIQFYVGLRHQIATRRHDHTLRLAYASVTKHFFHGLLENPPSKKVHMISHIYIIHTI